VINFSESDFFPLFQSLVILGCKAIVNGKIINEKDLIDNSLTLEYAPSDFSSRKWLIKKRSKKCKSIPRLLQIDTGIPNFSHFFIVTIFRFIFRDASKNSLFKNNIIIFDIKNDVPVKNNKILLSILNPKKRIINGRNK
tara:strand:- start:149 stop:565 length:417 start_codon:yes stop_codon:yes gene_type:complete